MLLNIILVIAFLGIIGNGWKNGAIQTLGRIIGSVLGFLLARSFSISLAFIFQIFLSSGWARFVAFVMIFLLVTSVIGIVFKLADGAFKIISIIPFVKSINRFLGAILGIVEAFVVLGGLIWMVKNFDLIPSLAKLLNASLVAHGLLTVFETLLTFLL